MEYLQEVLIPEAAVRLIQEDYKGIQIENAREIMLQSVHFGQSFMMNRNLLFSNNVLLHIFNKVVLFISIEKNFKI